MFQSVVPVAVAASLGGAAGPPSAELTAYEGSSDDIEVVTPAVEAADIRIDAALDDAAWRNAALLEGFTQFEPVEGAPALQRTEVLVLVDAEAIYFAVRAYDDHPSGVRATLSERDTYARSDDYVRFLLDTFDDQRRAYVFTVNPLGVQHDGLWNEGGGNAGRRGGNMMGQPIDDNPDFLWSSDATITEWGYQVEVRIPFKSLRFPERPVQSWGLQVERKIQRRGFESSWAPITRNDPNRLAQAGKLTGLRNLDAGLFMELNPVLTGTRIGERDEDTGRFERSDPTADFGMNATYGVTSNLTLDATYNPDFSQVEADAGQISVNERFSLFFPEKRPFFLEGTEIFGMAKQLVYTRSIANPIAGAKLTGKVGSVNVGYLGAVDEAFDAGDPDAVVNLLRVRHDVGESSTVGAIYTDRTAGADEFNRVAGADARLRLGDRYTVTLLGARSFTDAPDLAALQAGTMWHAQIERAGRTLSFSAEIEDSDERFDAGSGFFQRVGDTQVESRVAYNWFGEPGSLLEQIGPSINLRAYWDHDDFWGGRRLQEGEIQLGWRFSFKNNISFFGNVQRGRFFYAPEDYSGLFVEMPGGVLEPFSPDQELFDGLDALTLSLWVNKWERIRGNVRYTVTQTPIFERERGVAVEPAVSHSADLSLDFYPTRALSAELGVRQNRLVRSRDGFEHSSQLIPRLRAQYQFSRSLFVRAIAEYSTQETSPLSDPATGLPLHACDEEGCGPVEAGSGHDVHIEGLVSYEPSPGTVLFLGYSRQMEDTAAFGFRDLRPTADGLFVKLSYRFRM